MQGNTVQSNTVQSNTLHGAGESGARSGVLATAEIEVRLLGPVRVRRRDGAFVETSAWRTAKSLELVELLAREPGCSLAAELIQQHLWPGVAGRKAQASLRTATYHARAVLGETSLVRDGNALVLVDAWSDVAAYLGLVDGAHGLASAGRHRDAVEAVRRAELLHTGELDPGLTTDWAVAAREELRARRLASLECAADSAGVLGWTEAAIDFARRARQVDPFSERAVRVLMAAYASSGEMHRALTVFEELRHDLADQLGVDPAPATRALHMDLLRTTGPGDLAEGLVGHGQEVAALTHALLRARFSGGVIWLVGAPGTGRGAVLEEACRLARVAPRAPQLPRQRGAAMAPITATATPGGSAGDLVTLPELAMPGPEDLDRLAAWRREVGGTLVVPVRRFGPEALAHASTAPAEHTVVQLHPLPRAQVATLTRRVLQAEPSPGLVDAILATTGGRAGAVCQTVRQWSEQQRLRWSGDGVALGEVDTEAHATRSRVAHLLGTLDGAALDVLATLAVVEHGLDGAGLAAVTATLAGGHPSRHPGDLATTVERLLDAGAVRLHEGQYLLGDAERADVLAWTRPGARRRVHAAVAATLPLLPLPRLRHLVAAGEAAEACEQGFTLLAEAWEQGDLAASAEALTLLRRLPPHLVPAEDRPGMGRVLTALRARTRPLAQATTRLSLSARSASASSNHTPFSPR